jgi:hypothetical protein
MRKKQSGCPVCGSEYMCTCNVHENDVWQLHPLILYNYKEKASQYERIIRKEVEESLMLDKFLCSSEGPMSRNFERSIVRKLITENDVILKNNYNIDDETRKKIMAKIYNDIFSTNRTYKEIWGK